VAGIRIGVALACLAVALLSAGASQAEQRKIARARQGRRRRREAENFLAIALGIMSAIGGFVDIGDLVFNTQAGSAFGFQLMWVIVVGVVGIIVYSEMCGRSASASAPRAVADRARRRCTATT
jgi:Mn2+/Fe2+ NRAMP family transporter